ncbi:MAG: hypothetical protein CMH98_13825 [Oceanospirillaceae bacterium]|nr:hypothetical protein [Oceanospirillaceae bacterium]
MSLRLLLTISLRGDAGKKGAIMRAGTDGQKLYMKECEPLNFDDMATMLASLRAEMLETRKNGGLVILEERTGNLLPGCFDRLIDLNSSSPLGGAWFERALDHFQQLNTIGGIVVPEQAMHMFQVSQEDLDVRMGDGGKTVYKVNPDSFGPEKRCLMLGVLGVCVQDSSDPHYLKELYKDTSTPDPQSNMIMSIVNHVAGR